MHVSFVARFRKYWPCRSPVQQDHSLLLVTVFPAPSALAAVLQNVPVANGGTTNLSTFWWAVRQWGTALDSLTGISLIKLLDLTSVRILRLSQWASTLRREKNDAP